MRTPVRLGGRQPGECHERGLGRLIGPPRIFTHVGCEPWCSRVPCRSPFVAIFRWATALAWTNCGPAWTGVGLHAIHARTVHTALGCCKTYRSGSNDGPLVSLDSLQTALQTAFGHSLILTTMLLHLFHYLLLLWFTVYFMLL